MITNGLCAVPRRKGPETAGAVEEINTVLTQSFIRANLPPSELAWVSLHDTIVSESQHVAIIRLWQASR